MKHFIGTSLIFLIILLVSAYQVVACSCSVSPAVDVAFQQTANVVVMKLRSIEKYENGEEGYGAGRIKQAKLTVEKVYKGGFKVGSELTFAQGGGADCVWTFSDESIGNEYLFYLNAKPVKPNLWVAGTCSRSNLREWAAADLLYLDKRDSVQGKTRLSGTVRQSIDSAVEDAESVYRVLANRKIVVTGNGRTVELVTDAKGVYEVYGLAPGKYSVVPERVEGYKFGYPAKQKSLEVVVTAAAHTEANIEFRVDNRIAGRFFDAKGQPLKNVCVRLRPAAGTEARGLFEMDCTDASGRFSMEEIPSGTYVLVINEDGKVTADQPFGRFFYPAVKMREDAAELTIGPGEFHDDLIINAPETAEVITISGTLALDDGRPATDKNTKYVSIEFFADVPTNPPRPNGLDREPESRAQIDANGRFTIRILKGQGGRLTAHMGVWRGMYSNCPKLDRFILAADVNMPDLRSAGVQIDATVDRVGVELVFPFPSSCKLRPEE